MVTGMWKRLAGIYRSLYFPPLVIAVAILVATGATWRSSRLTLNQDIQGAITSHVNSTQRATLGSMKSYEEVLRGGVGFFRGSQEVTREDWQNFIQSYEVQANYPSAQAIGFVRSVREADVPGFESYMQTQIPGFSVARSQTVDGTYAVLTYAEAIAIKGQVNFGTNMYNEQARREALLKARDSGTVTITKRTTLRPIGDPNSYNGYIMFAPYYAVGMPTSSAEERRAALQGYVYASFRGDLFFDNVNSSADDEKHGFKVSLPGDSNPLYVSEHYASLDSQSGALHARREINVYGRTWIMDYAFDRTGVVSDVQLRRPFAVVMGGLFTAILIAAVVFLLLRARAQELNTQKEQAVELAKDELLSLASHQLRTPATGVKQYVGMVLQGFAGKVSKDQKALLEKAYASNDRQLSIINEILHLAKIDSGRIVLAKHKANLGDLVDDIVTEQRPDIKAAGHTLKLHTPKRGLTMRVDAHTLRMAIENLLSNAIKYTPEGGTISVRLSRDETHAYIAVQDSGVGIAQSDQEKLFKQFSRLSNEMSVRVGGTGIGLYLAKHLVELHGGRIIVESAPGKGSTFTIALPTKTRGK